ncbi:MAG: HAMP domain-containing protein, partial [Candidatus Omnitrophica bacterium]|nr:HAMP domain-containing protein [Candidatus Omnitrophota bacterium]
SENHIPYLTIAEPIKRFGKVRGILIADLNVRSIWDIVDAIVIGRSGSVYLIDRQSRIIAHQDKKKVLENASLTQIQVIQDVLSGQAGSFNDIDENGEPWLVSYAPIEKLNWGLIIAQSEKEAFAFSRKMNTQFLIIIALSVLFTLMISFILAHYMSRPMRDLIEGTERVSRGDFSHFFQIRGKSEINKLFFSFNRMTHKLRKAQEDEKLTVIGKASTAIAHELKNSLQMIDTFIKLLPERQGDKQFIKEFSETIPKELDSWNASLKNMMTFSKKPQFPIKKVDVNEAVKEIVLLTKLKARQLDIHLEIDLEDTLPLIMGNEEKLKQVLLNIVTNALEAIPHGGLIVFRTKSFNDFNFVDSGFVEIEIMNTGKGIEGNELNKIFEPFYSTKNGGLGLGLSISKEIIDHHNGNIKVVSVKNKTTSFIIRIPAMNAVVEENIPTQAHVN